VSLVIETHLKDGTPICLRTIRPSDEERLRIGIQSLSPESRYSRFFSAFRDPPPAMVKRLVAVDGHDHIGWGAIRTDCDPAAAIGAAHAVRLKNDETRAELAVGLLDDYHGLGLARAIIAAVIIDCAREAIVTLETHVLPGNRAAMQLVMALGGARVGAVESIDHYDIDVAATITLLAQTARGPVRDVLDARGITAN
jgi:GNAT superfamily N-acetyltransferase